MRDDRMPEPDDDSLETLRARVEYATRTSSLRSVARSVGMSPEALRKFLLGSTPLPRTRSKLAGLGRTETVGESWTGRAYARVVFRDQVAHLPLHARDDAARELRAVVARRSRAAGVPVPAWADDGLGN